MPGVKPPLVLTKEFSGVQPRQARKAEEQVGAVESCMVTLVARCMLVKWRTCWRV